MLATGYEGGIGRIAVEGQLSEDEARRCVAAIGEYAARGRAECGRARILVDASRAGIQSREIAFERDLARLLDGAGDRMAVVTNGALHAMQSRRVMGEEKTRYFADADEAIGWLG